jgi:hypothetical protein
LLTALALRFGVSVYRPSPWTILGVWPLGAILKPQIEGDSVDDKWWFMLVVGGGFLAFIGFAVYMDVKQQREDIKAGRPRRRAPDALM